MPYLASNPNAYLGKSVGNGQCVAYVRAAANAPHTSIWKRGEPVKTAKTITPGTIVATFDDNGRYGSRKDGSSHTAIFLQRTANGIVVLDQWVTNGKVQAVHERAIRFNNSGSKKINNGDEYYVVE